MNTVAGATRPTWSSAGAFYVAAVGAAVGLGSIWRLPYLVGSNGGSAFLFMFTLACVVIATPLLVAEFLIGRHSRMSPPQAAGAVAVASGVIAAMERHRRARHRCRLPDDDSIHRGGRLGARLHVEMRQRRIRRPVARGGCGRSGTTFKRALEMGAWHLAFMVIVGTISARGVSSGIEVATKGACAPAAGASRRSSRSYSLIVGDARAGLRFAFMPDWSQRFTSTVALAAIGQAFYATGVGAAMMIAYGAYVDLVHRWCDRHSSSARRSSSCRCCQH